MPRVLMSNQNRCKKKLADGTRCSEFALTNGYCRIHGGISKNTSVLRQNGKYIRQAESVKRELERHKHNLPEEVSNEVTKRIESMKKDPNIISGTNDIFRMEEMLESLLFELEHGSYNHSMKAKAEAQKTYAIMVELTSKIKERVNRQKGSYFDWDSVAYIIEQLTQPYKDLLSLFQNSNKEIYTKQELISILENGIDKIKTLKMPLITK